MGKLSAKSRRKKAEKKTCLLAIRIAKKYRSLGMKLSDIAEELNEMGMTTSRGCKFSKTTVLTAY